tara:strand:- start:10310 stop:12232 length:1923 start_codon:yes stop_codon:yes gene_type:complete
MGTLAIKQSPQYNLAAAGQPLVYTVSDQPTVLNESNVKFVATIYGGTNQSIGNWNLISTLKTTPNGAGVGMFDVSTIMESYVSASYQGRVGTDTENPTKASQFKGISYNQGKTHALHLIDKFCTNSHNMFRYGIKFEIEFLNTSTGVIEIDANNNFANSPFTYIFNGVLSLTSPLVSVSPSADTNYLGYNLQDVQFDDGTGDYIIRGIDGSTKGGRFVSNMPEYQQIRANDYGTVAFFNCLNVPNSYENYSVPNIETMPSLPNGWVPGIALAFYDIYGVLVQSNFYANIPNNAGAKQNTSDIDVSDNLIYFGHGLANMKGRNETWPANASRYTVYPSDGVNTLASINGGGGSGSNDDGEPIDPILQARQSVPPSPMPRPIRSGCFECGEIGPEKRYWKYGQDGECIYDTEEICLDTNEKECIRCLDEKGVPTGFYKWLSTGACIYTSWDECEIDNGHPDPDPEEVPYYNPIGRIYTYDIIGDDCHGFETVRLTWLNRMGTWDYYTFTKKNTYKAKTKGITYNQLAGTWNESFYNPYDHLGGDKIFINKTSESWDLNTDYINEETAAWFEEMFSSPDVYVLNQFSDTEPALFFSVANYMKKYIDPVTVGSKSYTKKTRANDSLIKYKFKVDFARKTNIQKA